MANCTLCRDGIGQAGPRQVPAVDGTDPPLCARCSLTVSSNNEDADRCIAEDAAIKLTHLRYLPCPDEGGELRWLSVGRKVRLCIWCNRSSPTTRCP